MCPERRGTGHPRRAGSTAVCGDDAGGHAGLRRGSAFRHFPAASAAAQKYLGRNYAIEPDASAASYFFAAAAIAGGMVTVECLSRDSLQGDVAFCDCLRRMGRDVDYAADHINDNGPPASRHRR